MTTRLGFTTPLIDLFWAPPGPIGAADRGEFCDVVMNEAAKLTKEYRDEATLCGSMVGRDIFTAATRAENSARNIVKAVTTGVTTPQTTLQSAGCVAGYTIAFDINPHVLCDGFRQQPAPQKQPAYAMGQLPAQGSAANDDHFRTSTPPLAKGQTIDVQINGQMRRATIQQVQGNDGLSTGEKVAIGLVVVAAVGVAAVTAPIWGTVTLTTGGLVFAAAQ